VGGWTTGQRTPEERREAMPAPIPASHPLAKLLAALTEQTFIESLGIGDPRLTGYVSDLLVRFTHVDSIWKLNSVQGRRLEEVAEMIVQAELAGHSANATREIHRHIGDFTLFWTGAYPEAIPQFRAPLSKDHLIDYHQQGKRSYWIASQYDEEPYREQATVLRQLSEQFELCAFGLNRVRREWEKADPAWAGSFDKRIIC
jgi:hypothetical protein